MTPEGSSSLERGNISNDAGSISSLTFEVNEHDGGEFTCFIPGSIVQSYAAHITVGNALGIRRRSLRQPLMTWSWSQREPTLFSKLEWFY